MIYCIFEKVSKYFRDCAEHLGSYNASSTFTI